MVKQLLWIIFLSIISNAIETSLTEWCDAGCNVVLLDNGFTYHCIYAYQHTKQIILSYPSNTQTSQCLYHALSYDNTSMHNMTLTKHDVDNECPSDCIDWHNGCTECLCINDNNSSLCNLNITNSETCSLSYIKHHCQMSKNELDIHGYDISLLTWFSIINISTDYEIWLPLSISNELKSILIKYISEYTIYNQYTRNISCDILYPYNYTNYYLFNNTNNTLNIDQLFNTILPHMNETYNTFNNTDIVNSSILFSTEFNNFSSFSNIPSISPSMEPTQTPIIMDSMNEYDGNYYNYIPQCTISFDNKQTAIQFIIDFRNHSNILRHNLHRIFTYYLRNNMSILLSTDDINETLYQYTQENEHLYIEYINNSQILHLDESMTDSWNNSTQIVSNSNSYELLLNKSLYSIKLNSFSYYFGNISHPLTTTLSPTKSPTKPRNCWFDGELILHNTSYYENECYFVECNNGKININDKYCDAKCYNKTLNNTNNCCITPDGEHCDEDNDDCGRQSSCLSCVNNNDRQCSWIGNHCSAVCVGLYCWNNGQCPKIIIIRLHIFGITIEELNIYSGLLNHAIAQSLDITENLIKNYYPIQTPNIEIIEIKKTISLTKNDENRIPNILSAQPNDKYVKILNNKTKKTFSNVPIIRSTIKIIDVEYGGFEGENNNKNKHKENDILLELTNNGLFILLICAGLVIITICALCYKYPILSYCCCCIPIKIRKKIKNCTKNNCCKFCQKFNFGILYDENMNDLIKKKRENRNKIIQEQYHLNNNNDQKEEEEEKEYHQLHVENIEKKNKKNKHKKKKKKKKYKKRKKDKKKKK